MKRVEKCAKTLKSTVEDTVWPTSHPNQRLEHSRRKYSTSTQMLASKQKPIHP